MTTSMFKMEDANVVMRMPLQDAKTYLLKKVKESTANKGNAFKAEQAIHKARNNAALATSVSNFILAHPENGMKVIGNLPR